MCYKEQNQLVEVDVKFFNFFVFILIIIALVQLGSLHQSNQINTRYQLQTCLISSIIIQSYTRRRRRIMNYHPQKGPLRQSPWMEPLRLSLPVGAHKRSPSDTAPQIEPHRWSHMHSRGSYYIKDVIVYRYTCIQTYLGHFKDTANLRCGFDGLIVRVCLASSLPPLLVFLSLLTVPPAETNLFS